jgi:hypothetical protein
MISYIRHDEEFHGVIKLITGEYVIGKMIAAEDEGKTHIYVQDPAEAKIHEMKGDNRKMQKGISFSKWMELSDEDFFVIPEECIVSVGSLSKEIIFYYNSWVNELDPNYKSSSHEVEVSEEMGKIASLKEAKNKLERIFNDL